ncbi:hypothetical protein CDAR_319971, partial [Caerostris darwini]
LQEVWGIFSLPGTPLKNTTFARTWRPTRRCRNDEPVPFGGRGKTSPRGDQPVSTPPPSKVTGEFLYNHIADIVKIIEFKSRLIADWSKSGSTIRPDI